MALCGGPTARSRPNAGHCGSRCATRHELETLTWVSISAGSWPILSMDQYTRARLTAATCDAAAILGVDCGRTGGRRGGKGHGHRAASRPASCLAGSARGQVKVVWSEQAWGRLAEIESFIARDDPGAASHLVDKLVDRTEALARHPHRGRRLPEIPASGLRELVVGNY